ncbi:HET-domain-containing protein [Apiospora arundinis]|uniref:HET-domain-containing protein n=1 Tax=Apiospora arundinis TaxID=335852 RepID=A0ABR2HMP8_9PEZI
MGPGPSTLASSSLCNTCRGLCENGAGWCWAPDATGKERPFFYLHHRRLSALFAKAKAGCGLCSLFCSGFGLEDCKELIGGDRCETEAEKRRLLLDVSQQDSKIVQLVANAHDHTSDPESGKRRSYEESDLESLRSAFGRERLIIKWQLPECSSEHDTLPAFLSVSWLGSRHTAIHNPNMSPIRVVVKHGDDEPKEIPTRLIDVNSNEPQNVRLVNTHRGSKAVYACLSYCWGQGGQYCTYKHNIKEHMQRICVSDLPAAVADAIRLCRALRIPFLWVDALCIVQDDEVDWNREAAAMASIYGSAALTISTPRVGAFPPPIALWQYHDDVRVPPWRRLTRDTDKLPALAGLAAQFRAYKYATCPRQQQYEYVAGLWWCGSSTSDDTELPQGLLWLGDPLPGKSLSRPAVYRAPSWSWAAVDGPIQFHGSGVSGVSKMQILDVFCDYECPGSLPSARAGWIDSQGLLRRAWPFEISYREGLGLTTGVEGHGEVKDDDRCSLRSGVETGCS